MYQSHPGECRCGHSLSCRASGPTRRIFGYVCWTAAHLQQRTASLHSPLLPPAPPRLPHRLRRYDFEGIRIEVSSIALCRWLTLRACGTIIGCVLRGIPSAFLLLVQEPIHACIQTTEKTHLSIRPSIHPSGHTCIHQSISPHNHPYTHLDGSKLRPRRPKIP